MQKLEFTVGFFYWFDLLLQFVLTSVSLLSMNSVIIHKLRSRSVATHNQDGESDTSKRKHTDTQIFIMLLFVTFGLFILVTPAYAFFLYVILVDFLASPRTFDGYYLFHSVAQMGRFSNHGVKFFFYVISGEKFRTDLKKLIAPFSRKFNGTSHKTETSGSGSKGAVSLSQTYY